MIFALIAPGLLRSRQAARRTECLNKLYQLGMAVQNYEHTMSCLPPGCVNKSGPIPNVAEGYHLGWTYQILPYIDQIGLYDAVNANGGAYGMSASGHSTQVPATFLCPSAPTDSPLPLSSYAGCIGGTTRQIDTDNTGLLYLNSSIRDEEIEDGRSNTFLAGEVRFSATLASAGLHWMTGTATTLRSSGVRLNATDDSTHEFESFDAGGFGSQHEGHVAFLIADGSARFVSPDTETDVLTILGDRADGQMLPATIDEAWRRTQNLQKLETVMQKMESP